MCQTFSGIDLHHHTTPVLAVSDNAPTAGRKREISLSFRGNDEDGTPAPNQVGGVTCGDCGGTPTSTFAQTTVDLAATWAMVEVQPDLPLADGRSRARRADDDPLLVRLVRAHLEKAGYRVTTAVEGEQALDPSG